MPQVPLCILSSSHAPQVSHGHDLDRFVQIGSLTKPLTGTLLVQLASTGTLQLDDHLEQFLPAPAGTGITLRHLAEHTAALPRIPPHLRRTDPYADFDAGALDSVVRNLGSFTTGSPGREAEYSNLGYALLGAALASAARAEYEELLHEHVLAPLGLTAITSNPPPDNQLAGRGFLGRRLRPWTMSGAILPAGGLWATPRDTAHLVTRLLVERRLGEPAPSWQTTGRLRWHDGATRGASVFAGAMDDGTWVMVHRLSGHALPTEETAARVLRDAVTGSAGET
ncbi:serine hydrolase domain-containing protein [Streptomyces anulatus]|uniref:serine hydrolase domain-containing protein n=1 Tax=Streptomyces TaxID=1883 RepID=UPI0009394AE6|nr:serine hydrolase domain-containing protein [Streptomyces sp. TSRI0395]OKI75471.1 beta-lactamase [Streptomyces sp. TSRI0395]